MHFSIPETVDRRDAKGSNYTVKNIKLQYNLHIVQDQILLIILLNDSENFYKL